MVYSIRYGKIQERWEKDWGTHDSDDSPYDVLQNSHGIDFPIGSGWFGFHLWADEHCTDRIEIDWGSRAWKCTGKELLDLNEKHPGTVYEVESINPDEVYGVVFIEES